MKICSKCGEEKGEGGFYFTGKMRKDKTQTQMAECKLCTLLRTNNNRKIRRTEYNIKRREWLKRNRSKLNADARRRYAANPKEYYKTARKWLKANPGKARIIKQNWRKKNRFSVALHSSRTTAKRKGYAPCTATVSELENLFTGNCVICGTKENSRKLSLEHDHSSGRARGFCCSKCNTILGMSDDSPELLEKAAVYLRSHGAIVI